MARPAGRVINNPAFALTPSLLAERPQLPVLVTAKVVGKYQNALDDITDDPEQYSTAELSEAHERLGIAQFHYGSWRESVANLAKALEHRRKLPVARSNWRTTDSSLPPVGVVRLMKSKITPSCRP